MFHKLHLLYVVAIIPLTKINKKGVASQLICDEMKKLDIWDINFIVHINGLHMIVYCAYNG